MVFQIQAVKTIYDPLERARRIRAAYAFFEKEISTDASAKTLSVETKNTEATAPQLVKSTRAQHKVQADGGAK